MEKGCRMVVFFSCQGTDDYLLMLKEQSEFSRIIKERNPISCNLSS